MATLLTTRTHTQIVVSASDEGLDEDQPQASPATLYRASSPASPAVTGPALAKYPHTRAYLFQLAKDLRPEAVSGAIHDGSSLADLDDEGEQRLAQLVSRTATLLRDDDEDEIKRLLKSTLDIEGDAVSARRSQVSPCNALMPVLGRATRSRAHAQAQR